jgi:hypothetical protein
MKLFLVELGRALMRLALDRAVRQGLPLIYKRLDVELPNLLLTGTPQQVKTEIAGAIAATTHKVPDQSQIEAVIGLYSPIAGAIRAFKK